ncbi:MAG: lytic transglycosylase domain-containing protein, partial [Gammaproteobacteria bacterium]|nr:lytic transglycosylase domain-containing protein [Gammaproteobacteria bacterium]
AAMYGIRDIYNPKQNIEAGVRHLRYLLVKYNYKLSHAIAAYNAGERAVKKYAGIPPYPETQKYVTKVLRYHGFYSTWN